MNDLLPEQLSRLLFNGNAGMQYGCLNQLNVLPREKSGRKGPPRLCRAPRDVVSSMHNAKAAVQKPALTCVPGTIGVTDAAKRMHLSAPFVSWLSRREEAPLLAMTHSATEGPYAAGLVLHNALSTFAARVSALCLRQSYGGESLLKPISRLT